MRNSYTDKTLIMKEKCRKRKIIEEDEERGWKGEIFKKWMTYCKINIKVFYLSLLLPSSSLLFYTYFSTIRSKTAPFQTIAKLLKFFLFTKKVMWAILIIIDLFPSSLALTYSYIKGWVTILTKKSFSPGAVRISRNISTTYAILDIVTAFYDNIHNNEYSWIILKSFWFCLSWNIIKKIRSLWNLGPSPCINKIFSL